ncbi:SDR family NAD(P)-dependent oxidoreductase [Planctomycetota bacterium]
MELKGLTAIITGSTGQLGSAIAKALAVAGCNCVCHYNSNEQLAGEIVEEIGGEAIAVQGDLSCVEGVERLFAQAGQLGTPRILINSAAVFNKTSLEDITFEQAQKVLDLNLTAPIMVSQAFVKTVREKFGETQTPIAKIINIVDIAAQKPWANYALYCCSKAGLVGATKALAKELAPGICVNAIAPGIVNWPGDFDDSDKAGQLKKIPAGRLAAPAEITEPMIFLLENDYITGQVLNIDGGRSL